MTSAGKPRVTRSAAPSTSPIASQRLEVSELIAWARARRPASDSNGASRAAAPGGTLTDRLDARPQPRMLGLRPPTFLQQSVATAGGRTRAPA